jgi:hypothetical protein
VGDKNMGLCTTKILNNGERARQTVTIEMMEKSGIEKHERKKLASTPRVSSTSRWQGSGRGSRLVLANFLETR